VTATLKQASGPAHTRIYSYGAARGENLVPNDDLIGPIDSSDEWIRQRTGIVTRARATHDTTAIDLAADAVAEAIERSGIPANQVDAVIVSTISNPKQTPSVSAIVADRVGANPAAAYDVNAACAGFAYGVAQADALPRHRPDRVGIRRLQGGRRRHEPHADRVPRRRVAVAHAASGGSHRLPVGRVGDGQGGAAGA
jgi:3-oxoacyl-[acyl-carrier-protein] synthase-3